MQIDKEMLTKYIDALEAIKPAQARSSSIPDQACAWSDGEYLLAYNGCIALAVPFAAGFTGAIPDILLGILRTFDDDPDFRDLELRDEDGMLRITSEGPDGSTRIRLCKPAFDQPFTMPESEGDELSGES
jgi:hypothetical protein